MEPQRISRIPQTQQQSQIVESIPTNHKTVQKTQPYSKIQNNKQFTCICIHKDTIYLGSKKSRLYIYKIASTQNPQENNQQFSFQQVKIITPQQKVIAKIKANDDYFVFVPLTQDESFISIWSAKTYHFLIALDGHKSQISQVVFMKNHKYLATSSWDSTIKIWSIQDFKKPQPKIVYKGNYPILQLKEFDDDILIFGGDDCYLVFWNWKKGEVIKRQFGHAGSVTYIEVMREYIFTSGGDNKFKFWQISYVKNSKTNNNIDSNPVFQKQKYRIQKIAEEKEKYESNVFGVCYQNQLLLLDKQGEAFLITEQKKKHHLGNFFETDQEVHDIDVFSDFLFAVTNKGILKHINIKNEINKTTFSLKNFSFIPSQTKIIKCNTKGSQQSKEN